MIEFLCLDNDFAFVGLLFCRSLSVPLLRVLHQQHERKQLAKYAKNMYLFDNQHIIHKNNISFLYSVSCLRLCCWCGTRNNGTLHLSSKTNRIKKQISINKHSHTFAFLILRRYSVRFSLINSVVCFNSF